MAETLSTLLHLKLITKLTDTLHFFYKTYWSVWIIGEHLQLLNCSPVQIHSSTHIDFQCRKEDFYYRHFQFNGLVVQFKKKIPIIFLDILASNLINHMNFYHGARNLKIWLKSISSVNINSQNKVIIKQTFGINWTLSTCYFMNTIITISVFIIIWNYKYGRKSTLQFIFPTIIYPTM